MSDKRIAFVSPPSIHKEQIIGTKELKGSKAEPTSLHCSMHIEKQRTKIKDKKYKQLNYDVFLFEEHYSFVLEDLSASDN